ncbi:MAG: DUF433 domain-containing protein [Actinobacteria bacterium]|nr:MAG: DUF433 domain-containing protein [Actinomycetota bacterium]
MARKSEPFSIRLSKGTLDLVAREAERTRRSKGAVVESLAEEAMRMRRFPGIAFREEDWNRRAWVIGTGLDVWEVIALVRSLGSPEAVTSDYQLSESQVATALAYHGEFPEEVDAMIAKNQRPLEELQREYPHITDTHTAE